MDNIPPTKDRNEKDNYLSWLKDLFEVAGKAVLGIFGLFYGTGLIVVSAHLNQYGIFSLSLLRLNYIMAGVWALLPIFSLSIILIIGGALLYRSAIPNLFRYLFSKSNKGIGKPDFVEAILTLWPLISFIVGVIVTGWALSDKLVSVVFTRRLITFAFPISLGIFLFHVLLSLRENVLSKSLLFYFSGPTLALFVGYVLYFGQFAYSKIPGYLGGGGASEAQLVIEADNKLISELEEFGIHFQENTEPEKPNSNNSSADQAGQKKESQISFRRTRVVKLILVTESEYLIIGNVIAVSVPKEAVKSVFYKNIYIGWGEEFSNRRK